MKCASCGKDQPERSVHCPFCGFRRQRDNGNANDSSSVEASRLQASPNKTLIEFPATVQRAANRQRSRDRSGAASAGADWRTELSERVRQVKERKNLQEVRDRLQAELEAAAQRYQQSGAPAALQALPSPSEQPLVSQDPSERSSSEERHPNPIIDAALRRAKRASEIADRRQPISNYAVAVAPKMALQPASKPAAIQAAQVEAAEEARIEPFEIVAPLNAKPLQAETIANAPAAEKTAALAPAESPQEPVDAANGASVSPPPAARARKIDNSLSPENRPLRVIKECESGPNYLDELISICEKNSSTHPAHYTQRAVAGLLDLTAILLFCSPYWLISYWMGVNLADQRVLALHAASSLILSLVYLTIAVTATGRTLGMIFVGTRIINSNTFAPPSLFQAALRSIGYLICTATFGLGFAWMFFSRERRGLHDILSGTSVVREY